MGRINPGPLPVAVRQTSIGAMTGVEPIGPNPAPAPGTTAYLPDLYTDGRYDYVHPEDHTLKILADGGRLRFDEDIKIPEIRGFVTGGTLDLIVEDRDGLNKTNVEATVSADGTRYSYHPSLIVLKSQQLIIKTSAAGSVDIYLRKSDSL